MIERGSGVQIPSDIVCESQTASSSLVLVWVPIMDGWSVFSRMLYDFYGFE
jgi:hypothetical protein